MIPSSVAIQVSTLQAGVIAAYPLSQAPLATLASLQAQANALVVALDSAIAADEPLVVAPSFTDPLTTAAALVAVTNLAIEDMTLVQLRALAGRVAVNLANAGV